MQSKKVMEKELRVLHENQQEAENKHDITTPTKLYILIVTLNMGLLLLLMELEKGSRTSKNVRKI